MTIRALLFGCWNDHDFLKSRNDRGQLILSCQTCGEEKTVLQTVTVTGPKSEPDRVYGEPRGKAIRLATKPTAVVTTFAGERGRRA